MSCRSRSGAEHEDQIDSRVHLTLPPPAGPLPQPHQRPKPRRSAKPTYSAAHPLRLWVAGDSLAQVPGDALERLGGAVAVVGVESRLSTGLARPDLYNWFTRFNQLIAGSEATRGGAVVRRGRRARLPRGRPRREDRGRFRHPELDRRVPSPRRRCHPRAERRRHPDRVWLGLPIPDGPGFRHSFPIVNSILASVAARHAKSSQYVDVWHLLDSANGTYTAYLRVHGKLTLMRLGDGVHYTAAAGDLVAQAVVEALRRDYRLR